MHKFVLNIFNFIKNFFYFLKILVLFFLMLHLLLWIQYLTHDNWAWIKPITPFLSIFTDIGGSILSGSTDIFGTIFEYKYLMAVGIYLVIYYFCNFCIFLSDKMVSKYEDACRYVNRTQEKIYNKTIRHQQEQTEQKYQHYKIVISASLKKKFSHPELGYKIEEQIIIMNKFLTDKTGVKPCVFEDGYLYSFDDFTHVDRILDVFYKLIKSNSPLDYVICLQIVEESEKRCLEELKQLLSLKHSNKISTLANSAYRYKFNKSHRYGVSQLGLFQKGADTIEVHEFTAI